MNLTNNTKECLAILGGQPVRKNSFPPWPQFDKLEEKNLLQVLRSRKWGRHEGNLISEFEQRFAQLCEVERSLMVSNGSTALQIALGATGVEAGDEVLVPPYTFMSTVMSVLLVGALPVFVDIDSETYCIDPQMMENRITSRTRAILPVHLAGMPCEMGAIMNIATEHNLVVIEDACQAHLAEWEGRKVGGIGKIGCFSFQTSKNISSGEGGAITSNDSTVMDYCFYYHTCGRSRGGMWYSHPHLGSNYRMTEFQAAILLAQLGRVKDQTATRTKNATYLSRELSGISGIDPLVIPRFVTTHAYHLYIFRYDAEAFRGPPRDTFVKALRAEGIPCSAGYRPLYKEEFIRKAIETRAFQKLFGRSRLTKYLSDIHCPMTEKACNEQAVWIPQPVLLGTKKDMNHIVEAIQKIHRYGEELNKTYHQ